MYNTAVLWTDYGFKQSKYEPVTTLPFRSIVVASSTGGKIVLIQNIVIGTVSPVYSFVVRPCITTPPSLKSRNSKKIIRRLMTRKKIYYDTYQPEELEEIINTQRKIM